MNNFTKLTVIMSLMLVAACAPPPVKVENYSPGVTANRLSAYKTFSFYKLHVTGDMGLYFETNLEHCKKAIASQMTSRGFAEAATDGDLGINIGVMLDVKNQSGASTQMRYMSEPDYTRHYQLKSEKNRVGTITIEMIDASKKSSVWIGTFSGAAPKNEDEKRQNIDQGVALLFGKFPVIVKR
jgi:hypothetical protein